MVRALLLASTLALLAGPSLAAEAMCSKSPASAFKPKADLEALLVGQGITVRQIKLEGGCYEVYAVDKDGKKYNHAFNAETLELVANVEAGEG
jgi:hypothetical protein